MKRMLRDLKRVVGISLNHVNVTGVRSSRNCWPTKWMCLGCLDLWATSCCETVAPLGWLGTIQSYVAYHATTKVWSINPSPHLKHKPNNYCIVQNFCRVKIWWGKKFDGSIVLRVLVRKIYNDYFSASGIWLDKILANGVVLANSPVFYCQNFVIYLIVDNLVV